MAGAAMTAGAAPLLFIGAGVAAGEQAEDNKVNITRQKIKILVFMFSSIQAG